ncbi:MAG: hypothetical protein D6702_02460 [Planctomycetota bacterium]|nr:MAG: hypothetical protein D6702_02460 [Planctomycetota bacterium]
MLKAKALERSFRGDRGGGIPWYAIVTAGGRVLATADGPRGNVGCPVTAEEIAHFMATLRSTRQRLGDAELTRIEQALLENGRRLRGG